MKTNKTLALALIMLASLPAVTFADQEDRGPRNAPEEEHDGMRQEAQERMEEMHEKASATRAEIQNRTEERREEIEHKRQELQSNMQERLNEMIHKMGERVAERLDATVDRLINIADRIDSRIEKFDEKGIDTTAAKSDMVTAREKIDAAQATIDEVKTAIEAITIPAVEPVATSTLGAMRSGKLETIREQVKIARQALMEAHKALVQVVIDLKGKSADDTASSTPEEGE